MNIKTPINNHDVVLKEWITGRELQEIRKPLTDVKMMIESGGKTTAEVNAGDAQRKSIDKAIEIVVLSVDGSEEDVVNKIYDMHSKDTEFVMAKVDAVVTGEDFTPAE
jgi:uncharacterized beta-barrel protein YwiB (DUF1934 family)